MATAMKALTIRQPWASLIVAGIKDVENRSWRTNYRGRLLVHAGCGTDRSEWSSVLDTMPRGQIIGSVIVADCVRDSPSEWAEADSWHWILAEPVQFDQPIPATGKLGLWSPARTAGVEPSDRIAASFSLLAGGRLAL